MSDSFDKKSEKERHRIETLRTWLNEQAPAEGRGANLKVLIRNIASKEVAEKLGDELIDEVFKEEADIDKIKELIRDGADVNIKADRGETALMEASRNGWEDVVEMLIHSGAKVDLKDMDGWSAIMWAVFNGYDEIRELLEDATKGQ